MKTLASSTSFGSLLFVLTAVLGASCTPSVDSAGTDAGGAGGSGGASGSTGTTSTTAVASSTGSGSGGGASSTAASGGGGGSALAELCQQTFGQPVEASCCTSASDFPDTCGVGACSCSPQNSHTIQTCMCPGAACFHAQLGCVAVGMSGSGGGGAVCTPRMDQTCNEQIEMSSFAGTCNADGTCTCNPMFSKQPSGKCG